MMSDPLFDTTGGADQGATDSQKLKQRQRVDDVKAQMSTAQGRRFVWSMLVATKFEGSSDTLFRTHGGHASYVLGAYEAGKSLAEEIRALCIEQYSLMVRENTTVSKEE